MKLNTEGKHYEMDLISSQGYISFLPSYLFHCLASFISLQFHFNFFPTQLFISLSAQLYFFFIYHC